MFLTLFTGILLGRVLENNPSLTSFPDIGGTWGAKRREEKTRREKKRDEGEGREKES
jgi:hypothetical protein